LPTLKRLFGDLAEGGTKGVVFEGGGEPLLFGEFPQALEASLERGLSAGLITNGLLLFGKSAPAPLLSELKWIRVSLDAASDGQFRSLKGSPGYAEALANVSRLCGLSPKPVVGVGYVLTDGNDDPALLRSLAFSLRDMGADYLQIRPVVDHPELDSRRSAGELGEALSGASGPGFNVDLAPLSDNLPEGNLGLPCRAHSITAVVGADTKVFICGRLNGWAGFSHAGFLAGGGTGERPGFKAAWTGELRKTQNRVLSSPSFCSGRCPRCRITKYNRLLDVLARLRTPDFI
jgi:hypothetical protein